MQTVIRLKRPLENSPSDSLILNCNKKQKFEETSNAAESLSTVLKFSGTQNSQNDDLTAHVKGIKDKLKQKLLQKFKHDVDIKQKLRLEAQERSKRDRYKIVNCLRSNASEAGSVTVLDIEAEESDAPEEDREYVYDIYYTDAKVWEDVDQYEIRIYETNDVFDADGECYVDSDHDSEDSNAEDYFTNDYPDLSDVESVDEDDMVGAMNKMRLDDFSSDDEFVHYGDEEELSDGSVNEGYYGRAYRRFKRRFGGRDDTDDDDDDMMSDVSDYYEE